MSQPIHPTHHDNRLPRRPVQIAVSFAEAELRWLSLSADRQHWTDPQKQRILAATFLRYHAAKLALETVSEEDHRAFPCRT